MEICKKQKLLCQLSATSFRFSFNFQYFEKKDGSHSVFPSEIIDLEGRRYLSV